jgi:hypothetical protein
MSWMSEESKAREVYWLRGETHAFIQGKFQLMLKVSTLNEPFHLFQE